MLARVVETAKTPRRGRLGGKWWPGHRRAEGQSPVAAALPGLRPRTALPGLRPHTLSRHGLPGW